MFGSLIQQALAVVGLIAASICAAVLGPHHAVFAEASAWPRS